MNGILFAFLVSCMLLVAGCAAPQPEEPGGSAPQMDESRNETPVQAPVPAANETAALPAQQNDTNGSSAYPEALPETGAECAIRFQKDISSVYYVMVDTGQEEEITVKCPNGEWAEKTGGIFFCTQLDVDSPVIAYSGGEECDRTNFSSTSEVRPDPGTVKCSITLSNPRITMGQSTVINVQTSSGAKEIILTYNCGTEEKTQKRSGLVTDGSICTFNTPGTIEIYAKADGVVCATKMLQVFESAKDCSVLSDKLEYTTTARGEHVYTADVAARGYNSNDRLTYSCYDDVRGISVRDIPNSTDFVLRLECRGKEPLDSPVWVKIGSDACGEASP